MKKLLIILSLLFTSFAFSEVNLYTSGSHLNIDSNFSSRDLAVSQMTNLWEEACLMAKNDNPNYTSHTSFIDAVSPSEFELKCELCDASNETNPCDDEYQVAIIEDISRCGELLLEADAECGADDKVLDTFQCNEGDDTLQDITYSCINADDTNGGGDGGGDGEGNGDGGTVDTTGEGVNRIVGAIGTLKASNKEEIEKNRAVLTTGNSLLGEIKDKLTDNNAKTGQIVNKLGDLKTSNQNAIKAMKDGIVAAVNDIPGGGGSTLEVNIDLQPVTNLLTEIKDQDKAALSGGSADCRQAPSCTGGNVACATAIINWRSECIALQSKNAYNEQANGLQGDINQAFPDGVKNPLTKALENKLDVSNVLDYSGGSTGSFTNETYTIVGEDVELNIKPWEQIFTLAGIFIMISMGYRVMRELVSND